MGWQPSEVGVPTLKNPQEPLRTPLGERDRREKQMALRQPPFFYHRRYFFHYKLNFIEFLLDFIKYSLYFCGIKTS